MAVATPDSAGQHRTALDGGTPRDTVTALTNTGALPVSGWMLSWPTAPGQGLVNGWNATVSQSGGTVTAQRHRQLGCVLLGAARAAVRGSPGKA
ncbi:cellulose binding domain-containing protein [Micromonospora sp. CPCC 205371]|nr:cellulose binding domain-containing protein [Micromonospora sp. CPCC 205371]